jgi:hypothetical protein
MRRQALLPLALLTLAFACGDKDDTDAPLPDDSDTDTDADTDTDTDTDADADTDADSDADADTDADTDTTAVDADGDGHASRESGGDDCDDGDAAIHPGADEACNGLDDDCDGDIDEERIATLADGRGYTVLQDAIDAAASGASIAVCAGTWSESIFIDKDLTLQGTAGAAVTILERDSASYGSTVTVQRGHVLLEGLTLSAGIGTSVDGNTWGGGLYAGRADSVELKDCVVRDNSADFGGGIAGPSLYPATLILTDTVVQDNTANFAGGGFLIFYGSLVGAEITGNRAPYGGGGTVWYWDVVADSGTVIHDNSASDVGGGLMIWDEGQLTMTGTTLTGNTAGGTGGAIHIDDGGVTCSGCDLGTGATDNSPDDVSVEGRSGVVSYSGGSPVTFSCTSTSGACTGL